jgi:preprotein translocase subunit SecA
MSELRLRPWLATEISAEPYPERHTPQTAATDVLLHNIVTGLAPRPVLGTKDLTSVLEWVDGDVRRSKTSSDAELLQTAKELRNKLLAAGLKPELIGGSFALVSEVTARRLGLRHYPVQLIGGYALLLGRMVEMETGEGKTITAILPAVTAAPCGVPVHVITVSDYLAKRDREWLQPVYDGLGLSVGLVQHGQDPLFRRNAYQCDITYCTNKEVAFDYLRDRIALRGRRSMAQRMEHDWSRTAGPLLLLRGLHFGIVDEADSVLIDEARTPLIISSEAEKSTNSDLYKIALGLARGLKANHDFSILQTERATRLTNAGADKVALFAAKLDGVWRSRRGREELVEQALAAINLFERDKHYIVMDDN